MNSSFLQSERLYLWAVEPEDLDLLYQMENAPEMWAVSSFVEPYSRFTLREYIASSQNDVFADKQLRLMIGEKGNRETVGTIDLDHFDPLHLRAGVGLAVLQSFRRKGYALEALELLMDYSFRFLHLHQLYAYIPIRNVSNLGLFQKTGFCQVAVLTEWLRTPEGFEDVTWWQKIHRIGE